MNTTLVVIVWSSALRRFHVGSPPKGGTPNVHCTRF
jgi:hypothetical protein